MSGPIRTTVRSLVEAHPGVVIVYEVVLTPDARAVLSRQIASVEYGYWDAEAGRQKIVTLTPEEARHLADTILRALEASTASGQHVDGVLLP